MAFEKKSEERRYDRRISEEYRHRVRLTKNEIVRTHTHTSTHTTHTQTTHTLSRCHSPSACVHEEMQEVQTGEGDAVQAHKDILCNRAGLDTLQQSDAITII